MGKLEDELLELLIRRVSTLSDQLVKLQVSVTVLKVLLGTQLLPGQPEEALKQIESLVQRALAADPTQPKRKRDADLIDALLKLRKRGVVEPDS